MSNANGRGGRCRARFAACPRGDEGADEQGDRGTAAVELALALPFVVLAVVLLLHAAVFGADAVAAQGIALQAARVASISDDAAVADDVRRVAGRRRVDVDVTPPAGRRSAGALVTASIRLRSAAFRAFGADVWIPARATLRTERP